MADGGSGITIREKGGAKMKTETINCMVITPMYVTGADNRTPELRAPSFKAMMRFWWRAAVREADLTTLKRNEAKIFGADSEKGGRSSFTISVTPPQDEPNKFFILPHKVGNRRGEIQCYTSGNTFQILITARDQATLDTGKTTFELAALLGGVGRRSRRGFGVFTRAACTFNNEQELLDVIAQKLNKMKPSGYQVENGTSPTPFITPSVSIPLHYPAIKKIETVFTMCSPDELLTQIGRATSRHHGIGRGGQSRLASPVVVSACPGNGCGLFVVITTLHSTDASVTSSMIDNFIQEVRKNVQPAA
ncbi:type III-B CRISPR module RAMP protein Cmr1 [Candidatus Parcubacteria bacterium]|nr:MAG: type III-B CRISPR module RAMP protein Cmr1 [Candidatus Parcubacteria bacterium]